MKKFSCKKLVFFVFATAVFFAMLAVTGFAEDYGNFAYTCVKPEEGQTFEAYNEINSFSFTEGTDDPVVLVPETIEDIPVTTICASAFSWKDKITEVILPDTVTTIENGAFYNCSSLKVVIIPDSVKYIGDSAFQNCASLEYVIIGDGLETLGDLAFKGCSSLKYLDLGSSVKEIGSGAFFNCPRLKNVVIPDSVEKINSQALGLVQDGNGVKLTEGFRFYAYKENAALTAYAHANTTITSEDTTSADAMTAAVEIISDCGENNHSLQYTKVRSATEDYKGLEIARCSKCFRLVAKDNTDIEKTDEGSTEKNALIATVVIVAVLVIVGAVYIIISKKKRAAAIEEYRKTKKPLK